MITSASDDCTIKVWDPRKRGGDAVTTFNNNYQVMSVCFNDTADQVITGGLDNEIKVILLFIYFSITHVKCLI
jgi:Prp8 binding protein